MFRNHVVNSTGVSELQSHLMFRNHVVNSTGVSELQSHLMFRNHVVNSTSVSELQSHLMFRNHVVNSTGVSELQSHLMFPNHVANSTTVSKLQSTSTRKETSVLTNYGGQMKTINITICILHPHFLKASFEMKHKHITRIRTFTRSTPHTPPPYKHTHTHKG